MRLFDNPRFQSEYQEWSAKLKLIENEKVKNQLNDLLNQLVRKVQDIDSKHEDAIQIGKMRDNLNESRDQLIEIRRKISRIVRDWDETQK